MVITPAPIFFGLFDGDEVWLTAGKFVKVGNVEIRPWNLGNVVKPGTVASNYAATEELSLLYLMVYSSYN